MRLIRFLVRTFIAWTLFIFILGALFAGLGGQRSHLAVLVCDGLFLLAVGYGVARWSARRRARREAEQAAIEAAAQPVFDAPLGALSGQGVTAVTVFIGSQPGQIAAVASEVPADRVPFADVPALPVAEAAPVWEAEVVPEQPVVEYVPEDLPGSRGARMALAAHTVDGTPAGAIGVHYGGVLKAYVTRESWEQVGDFAELTPEDPEYRLVSLMSLYAQQVLLGYEAQYTDADGLAYALAELVPHEILERDISDPVETARGLRLPDDALAPENLRGLRAALAARNEDEAAARQQVEQ